MGKFDHIVELLGADTYPSWRRAVRLALAGEGLWNHCSSGTDPNDIAEFASSIPAPATAGSPTADERKAMKEWLKEDAQAKAIIGRKLSPVVQNMLNEDFSAREQWEMLAKRFARLDVTSQFELRTQLFTERLKDADDASRYLGVFENGRRRFAEMGVTFTDEEAIWMFLHGLPDTPQWVVYRSLTIGMYNNQPTTSSSATPATQTKVTFEQVATSFSEEASRQSGQLKLARPGSEYANVLTTVSAAERKVNPATGVRVHKNNPKGVPCDNPVCTGLPRSLTHDREHCMQQGGGMEGKAPWARGSGAKSKKDVAAVAAEATDAGTASSSTSTAQTPTPTSSHRRDLSCALIEEIPPESSENFSLLTSQSLSTILDSGTTSTVIMDRDFFWTYSSDPSIQVKTANHGTLSTSGRGDCIAELTIGGKTHRLRLTNCLHAPGALINLLSIGHMLKRGWECNFKPSPSRCQLIYKGKTLGDLPLSGNLCPVNLRFIRPDNRPQLPIAPTEISAFACVPLTWDLWHARLGHIGGEAVKRAHLIGTGFKVEANAPLRRCEPCIVAKHPRKPFPSSVEPRAAHPLDLVHSDLCGPFPVITPHGKHHFIIFLDDHSNLLNLQLLATKDQALDAWLIIKARWETHLERKVKIFRSDNGGEFVNAAFTKALQDAGIERQLSAPYAHQQNGKAERAMRTIEGRLFAMLTTARLPANLWGEAALTVCYLWNRSESRALPPGTTPFEIINGTKPDFSHLRVFGASCFARIPSELQAKLGPHSRQAIFLGYPEGTKGYRLRDKVTGTFFVARDVIFDENLPSIASVHDSDDDDDVVPPPPPDPTPTPAVVPGPAHAIAPAIPPAPPVPRRSARSRILTSGGQAFADGIAASKARLLELRQARAARSEGVTLDANAPAEHGTSESVDLEEIEPNVDVPETLANLMIEEHANIAIRSDRKRDPSSANYDMKIPPATYEEAMLRPDRQEWLSAMEKELKIMAEMNVYQVVALPAGRKAIGNRWVLEFKDDNKGGSTYKARLVAQGFSQIPGVDYGATFAPVLKTASLRFIAALACKNNWDLDTFNAKCAFLWGVLKEEIYMRQPKGFEHGDWKVQVWRMLRTIYGLKQSAMEWYEEVRAVMDELGFTRCAVDYAVFVYDQQDSNGNHTFCVIGWHVDDSLGTSNSPRFLAHVKGKINARFGIKDFGAVNKFLGIQFERDRLTRHLWMHQAEYITYLLEEYSLLDSNPVSLPLDANHPFGRPSEVHPVIPNLGSAYRKLIGELLYLAVCTRPASEKTLWL